MVVTDPELRAEIGEYYRRSYDRVPRVAGRRAATLRDRRRRSAGRAELGGVARRAHGRGPGARHRLHRGRRRAAGENQAGLWGSLLPAAWSYQLAARARGLGSAWTTLHLRYEKEIAELLGIPPNVRQGVLLPTAYYTGETFKPAPREPLDTVLHIDRW